MTDRFHRIEVHDGKAGMSEIRGIVHAQVVLDPASIAAFGVATATAACPGLTTDMKVLALLVASGSSAAHSIDAARCPSANIVELTFGNHHSAANDLAEVSANILGFR